MFFCCCCCCCCFFKQTCRSCYFLILADKNDSVNMSISLNLSVTEKTHNFRSRRIKGKIFYSKYKDYQNEMNIFQETIHNVKFAALDSLKNCQRISLSRLALWKGGEGFSRNSSKKYPSIAKILKKRKPLSSKCTLQFQIITNDS